MDVMTLYIMSLQVMRTQMSRRIARHLTSDRGDSIAQCTMEKLVLSGGQIVETDFFDLYRSGK